LYIHSFAIQLFDAAHFTHFTRNILRWHLKSTSHPVKYFTEIVKKDVYIQIG